MKKVNQLFFGSSSLISLDLSMLSFSNSEDMTSKFNGMENILSIIFDNFDSKNVESMHYMLEIERYWFYKNKYFKSKKNSIYVYWFLCARKCWYIKLRFF